MQSSPSTSPDDRSSTTSGSSCATDLRFHPHMTCTGTDYFSGHFGSLESLSSSSTKMADFRSRNGSIESLRSVSGNSIASSHTSRASSASSSRHDDKATQKYAHISNEHVRLTQLLQVLKGDELKALLQKRLETSDARVVVALSVLLPRHSFPTAVTHLHCVRCHKTFDPREHSQCVLRHPNSKVVKTRQNRESADFRCAACGSGFRLIKMMFYDENVNSYLSGFCYSGTHTTNLRDVTLDGAVMLDGAVKTCEEYGCVEVYV